MILKLIYLVRFAFICLFTLSVSMATVKNAGAYWPSIQCSLKAGTALPADYGTRLCFAEDLVRQGKFDRAINEYKKLLDLPIYESPNFEVLVDLARAQCINGNFKDGINSISEFELAMSIFEGKRSCENISRIKTTVGKSVHKRMCGELLQGTYSQQKSSELVAQITDLRNRANTTSSFCKRQQSVYQPDK